MKPFWGLQERLSIVFGCDLGEIAKLYPEVSKRMYSVPEYCSNHDRLNAEYAFGWFDNFVHQLEELKKSNPVEFDTWKKTLNKTDEAFHGVVFESTIASLLTSSGIGFTMPDPPDFIIQDYVCKLETTSIHFHKGPYTSRKIEKKLLKKIFDKNQEPYADRNCALCIDATALFYTKIVENRHRQSEALIQQLLLPRLYKIGFGSILVFRKFSNPNHDLRIYHEWQRFDCEGISPGLFSLLDNAFPTGKIYNGPMLIPNDH